MKVFAEKLRQRHLQARRRYWQGVYTYGGMRRVPLPCVEMYNEEGEIVPVPPLARVETPLFKLIPRKAPPNKMTIVDLVNGYCTDVEYGGSRT